MLCILLFRNKNGISKSEAVPGADILMLTVKRLNFWKNSTVHLYFETFSYLFSCYLIVFFSHTSWSFIVCLGIRDWRNKMENMIILMLCVLVYCLLLIILFLHGGGVQANLFFLQLRSSSTYFNLQTGRDMYICLAI